jgi:hypothetical protein
MRTVRLDRAVGRRVLALNRRSMGRLEEIRVEPDGGDWVITEYVIGRAGLLQRLHLGLRLLVGLTREQGFVARWDQLSIDRPEQPQLLCHVSELRRL